VRWRISRPLSEGARENILGNIERKELELVLETSVTAIPPRPRSQV
jgi:hypothetical protein